MKVKHYNKLQRKRTQNHYDRVKKVKQKHLARDIVPLWDIN